MREGYAKTENYEAEIVADSISPEEVRLTSIEVTLPRMVLSEFNTHRMFSRNSASSRAIPVQRQIERVFEEPYIPLEWGRLQSGMQSTEELSPEQQSVAQEIWLQARDEAIIRALGLIGGIGAIKDERLQERLYIMYGARLNTMLQVDEPLHKQFVNRLLEPFSWHTVLVTATEWSNFYGQRLGKSAQPEIRLAATHMHRAVEDSVPKTVGYGAYHLPYIDDTTRSLVASEEDLLKVSAARSARLSYLTQHNPRPPEQDIELHDNGLVRNGHMSPLEHVASPISDQEWSVVRNSQRRLVKAARWLVDQQEFHGNFRGWHQWRKQQPLESDFAAAIEQLGLEE